MNPLNLPEMKKTVLSLFAACAASLVFAVDVPSVVNTLGGDDYAARMQARLDLKQAFAEAVRAISALGQRRLSCWIMATSIK